MGIIAQGELVGNARYRLFKAKHGRLDSVPPQSRTVRIFAGLNEKTGEMYFKPAKLIPYAVSLLSRISLAQGQTFDIALQKPSLQTARKRGASTSGVNMDRIWRSRGGRPHLRPLKTGGFGFKTTAQEIAAERRRKKRETRDKIFYQAHP